MSPDLLALFDPSPSALIDLLRERIDDSMVREIAGADVPFNVDANLRELIPIRRTGKIPAPLEWEPKEVLELTRWTEPDDLELYREIEGHDPIRGHVIRAFACALLLRAGGDHENDGRLTGEVETLVQLLVSTLRLDREVQRTTAQLIAWRLAGHRKNVDDETSPPFFELALFWLALFLDEPPWDERTLVLMADGIVAAEAETREATENLSSLMGDLRSRWMIGLTVYNQKIATWELLAGIALNAVPRLKSDVARDKVSLISELILGQTPPSFGA